MLRYIHCEIAKELADMFVEESKKDENLISKFVEGFKKIKEKLIEGSQSLEVYAKILLELADRSSPFGISVGYIRPRIEKWIKDAIDNGDKVLQAKQVEIANFYERVLLKIIMSDLKILLDQYMKKMSGCLLELRKS